MLEDWMNRKQLLELEDQRWFPSLIRGYMQDYLHFMATLSPKPFSTFVNRLHWAMHSCGETRIVDLCSGSGGPVDSIVELMEKQERFDVKVQLTDLFPNIKAMRARERANARISGVIQPVDATLVPANLRGFRLMCNSFHHFKPQDAQKILGNAVENGQGIAIVELVNRSLFGFVSAWFGAFTQFFFVPFMRPFSLGRVLFTYLIPLIPLATLWDGTVSCLRVYSPSEMEELILPYRNSHYQWEIGKVPTGMGPALNYLIGYPRKKA
jgi:hypothetical protein